MTPAARTLIARNAAADRLNALADTVREVYGIDIPALRVPALPDSASDVDILHEPQGPMSEALQAERFVLSTLMRGVERVSQAEPRLALGFKASRK